MKEQNQIILKKKSIEDNLVCKCSKSKCLKMYCECFRAGFYCDERCNCCECHNLEEYQDEIR